MKRSSGLIGVTVMVCVLGTGPAAAAEPAEPPIAFVKTDPLSATCAELASEGVEVAIRNETGAEQLAKLAPVEFSDADGASVAIAEVCGGLRVTPPKVSLDGAESTTVKLEGDAAREGSFSGTLTLSAARGRVARRSVSIVSEPIPAEATPLVESQNANRNHLDPGDQGPIWVPVDLALKELPRLPSSKKPATLGALAGSNGAIAVTYSGERKKLTDTTSLIGLNVSDSGPGSYTGTVDLLPSDEEAGKVTLGLTMTTWWPFPAIVLIIGIVIGVWLLRQTGLVQPQGQLLKRIEDLGARLSGAKRKLDEAADSSGKAETWGAFYITDVETLQDKLRERVLTSTKGVVIKIDEEVLKDLKTRIAAVETQIELLAEIPDHAGSLEAALGKRTGKPELPLPPLTDGQSGDPRLVVKANEAMTGSKVKAAELKPLVEKIDTRIAEIATLAGLENRLSELWAEKLRLEKDMGEERLTELVKSLKTIRQLLFKAVGSEDFAAATTKIQQALTLIIDLGLEPKRAVAMAVRDLGILTLSANVEAPQIEIQTDGSTQVRWAAPASSSTAPASSTTPLPTTPKPQLSKKEAGRQLHLARWNQAIVILLAGLTALASGMALLYVGKAWGGSFWDWLAIFVWGIAAQTTVSALATSIDGAALLRRVSGGAVPR